MFYINFIYILIFNIFSVCEWINYPHSILVKMSTNDVLFMFYVFQREELIFGRMFSRPKISSELCFAECKCQQMSTNYVLFAIITNNTQFVDIYWHFVDLNYLATASALDKTCGGNENSGSGQCNQQTENDAASHHDDVIVIVVTRINCVLLQIQ